MGVAPRQTLLSLNKPCCPNHEGQCGMVVKQADLVPILDGYCLQV